MERALRERSPRLGEAIVNGPPIPVTTTTLTGTSYSGPGADTKVVPLKRSVAGRAAGATGASEKYFASARVDSSTVSAEFFPGPAGNFAAGPVGEPVWIVGETTGLLYGSGTPTGAERTSVANAGTGNLYSASAASVLCWTARRDAPAAHRRRVPR